MIYVYGVAYYCADYVLGTIHSLRRSAREIFNLTVAENESPNSPAIGQLLRREVESGNVDTYIVFNENLLGSSLKFAYNLNPPGVNSEDFVVFTDLDLRVPDGVDWIQELRQRFAHPEVGLVAFDLDPVNYETPLRARLRRTAKKVADRMPYPVDKHLSRLPDMRPLRGPNWGQLFPSEDAMNPKFNIHEGLYSGMWLCGVRKKIVDDFIDICHVFLDRHLNHFAQSSGFVIGRMPVKLYHYGWNAWKDYPAYYKHKLSILREFHNEARELSSYKIISRKGEAIEIHGGPE